MDQSKQIHIISAGTPQTTHVYTPDGEELKYVRSAFVHFGQHGGVTATLEFYIPHVDTDAKLEEIRWTCPFCDESLEHKCK